MSLISPVQNILFKTLRDPLTVGEEDSNWVVGSGSWNDDKLWIDTEKWKDS